MNRCKLWQLTLAFSSLLNSVFEPMESSGQCWLITGKNSIFSGRTKGLIKGMFMQTVESTSQENHVNSNWNIVSVWSHGDSLLWQQLSEIKRKIKIFIFLKDTKSAKQRNQFMEFENCCAAPNFSRLMACVTYWVGEF